MTAGARGHIASRRPPGKLAVEHEAGRRCEGAEILRARRLLDENVSLVWSEIQVLRGVAAASTVEALVHILRGGGTALACPHARRRLAELSEAQLHEVCARLQRFQPPIARAWTPGRGGAPRRYMERFTWMRLQSCLSKLSSAFGMRGEQQRLRGAPTAPLCRRMASRVD